MKKLIFIPFLILMFCGSVNAATVTRYVNTGSTGGNGTTSALTGTDAAYASLSAWEDAEDGIDYTGDDMVVYCAGATNDTTVPVCAIDSGWTADSIEIIGDADGAWDDNHYTAGGGGDYEYITVGYANVTISNIQFDQGSTSNNRITVSQGGFVLRNSILKSDSAGQYLLSIGNASTADIYNNVFYGSGGEGIDLYYPGVCTISNNTFYDCDYGIYFRDGSSTNITATNNVAIDCLTADFSVGSASVSNNCSSDTSATGTGSLISKTAANNFTDAANGDFTIKDTSADIYDAGTDPETSTDITGYSWVTNDIGAFALHEVATNSQGLLPIW